MAQEDSNPLNAMAPKNLEKWNGVLLVSVFISSVSLLLYYVKNMANN